MIWFASGIWSHAAGEFFVRTRIYRRGRWTPFVRVRWRHGWLKRNSKHQANGDEGK